MEVNLNNGKQQLNNNNNNHHLTCLSGSSQSPLINTERASSTLAAISLHNSNNNNCDNIKTEKVLLNNNNNNNNSKPFNSIMSNSNNNKASSAREHHPHLNTPLVLNPTSASSAQQHSSSASIFFPPLPARSSHQQLQTTSGVKPPLQNTSFESVINRSPRSADVNMNAENERNRESARFSTVTSTNVIATATATSQSSRLNSPIIMPSKSFAGFFAEPHFQAPPQARRSINLINNNATLDNNEDKWPHQQDDTYHLYHEPIDPDDEESPVQLSPQTTQLDNFSPGCNQVSNTKNNSNNIIKSPTDGTSRRSDVSADIYFCYVTLKSNERSNQRSRSYHGPKNTNFHGHQQNAALSSTASVTELPISPTAFHLRDHCVRELIETESNYVHALDMIITCFAKPLEPFFKRDEYQLIFSHVKYFFHIHSAFQADLVKNALNVSSCFLNVKDKFLKYGEYCATLSKAQALLDDLTNKNEAIAAQLDRCQQEANEGKFKLRDLLSLPMQRILKYHLLLAQLIKNTSASNQEDYHSLRRAHEAMVDLGQYINEVKRDTEVIQIINDIEQSVTGLNMPSNTQLTDYGRLVTDGFIRIKAPHDVKANHHDTKVKQKRYVFVFDKVMLMCKVSGIRGYQYKEALVLSEYVIDTTSALTNATDTSAKHLTKDKWSYNFNLIRTADNTTYSFYAKTQEMRNRWVESIQKAMDNIRPAACRNNETNHEFLMHTFERASSCDHCGKLLHGLYYQGYRCRTCFTSAHKKCLAATRPCGPTLPPKPNSTPPQMRGSCNEPPSPSVRSICSDDSHNFFTHFPCPLQEMSLKDNDVDQNETGNSYVNFILNDYLWFCGRMERDRAQSLLENMPHGTFLVRVSPKHNGSYVISLNYNSQVKHMRIYVSKDNQLYLSQNRYFKSVIELVSWYEKNSLVESFHMLDARLAIPFKAG